MFRNFPVHSGIYVTLNGINRTHGLFIKSKTFGEMSSLNGIPTGYSQLLRTN